MPKKLRGTSRREILNRAVDITSFGTSLRVGVDEPKDPEPEIEVKPWLELQGYKRANPPDLGRRDDRAPGRKDQGWNGVGARSALEVVIQPHAPRGKRTPARLTSRIA